MTKKTPKKRNQDNYKELCDDDWEDFIIAANFYNKLSKMPAAQALEILKKAEEQDSFIASLEHSEYETFYSSSDEENRQEFFEDVDEFYPDDD